MAKDKTQRRVVQLKQTFEQAEDCCGSVDEKWQHITLETFDGGCGPYVVITTERWATDGEDARWLAQHVAEMCKEVQT